jgi:hypothetical protein
MSRENDPARALSGADNLAANAEETVAGSGHGRTMRARPSPVKGSRGGRNIPLKGRGLRPGSHRRRENNACDEDFLESARRRRYKIRKLAHRLTASRAGVNAGSTLWAHLLVAGAARRGEIQS